VPLQSPANNWLGDFKPSGKDDQLDLQRNIFEFSRIVSPYLAPSLYGAPINVGLRSSLPHFIVSGAPFSDGRNILGYKGHVCKKCLSWRIEEIRDDEKRILSKSNHTCDPQKLHEAQSVTDATGTIYKRRRQELISYLPIFCVINIYNQQELLNLAAVEIPPSVFDNWSDSYEEYVDLDTSPSGTPDWAYGAVKKGKTVINRTDLGEFLNIFEATLGFFRLTMYGVKHYFFVYIVKGLEPSDIKYIKKFLDADTLITTSMSIAMNNSVINREWKDMFIDGPLTCIPPLKPGKFNFLLNTLIR
jgi:hypothetical protein